MKQNSSSQTFQEVSLSFQYINIKYLKEICPDNEGFAVAMLESFKRGSAANIAKIQAEFAVRNFDEIKKIAHTAKPTGAYIGAHSYTSMVSQLEEAAVVQDAMQTATLIASMQEMTNAIVEEINLFLNV